MNSQEYFEKHIEPLCELLDRTLTNSNCLEVQGVAALATVLGKLLKNNEDIFPKLENMLAGFSVECVEVLLENEIRNGN